MKQKEKITENKNITLYSINISGIVQGVGFRPFIYKLAKENNLNGRVTNTTEGISIKVEVKNKKELSVFIDKIKKFKPSPSLIEKIEYHKIPQEDFQDFAIAKSIETDEKFQLISPDLATCPTCIEDINNKEDLRRYYYPFTNCTNCGPRFTIIKKMPYDRQYTTMLKFEMCPDCKKEYDNPFDRRFHAQPNACKICGPVLSIIDNTGKTVDTGNPILTAARLLKNGFIIGIKSLGGFQVACDATNDDAILKLRKRKNRPQKPFAVMFRDMETINRYLAVSILEQASLTSPSAPIVLLEKNKILSLSKHVSYYNKYEGAMLPYTPLHHLLFNNIDFPLVMTSGNISEEPIASENKEALFKLQDICDYFLTHNRDIYSKYDDSVIKIFNDTEMILRRARGYAPYPIKLGTNIGNKVILAVGAQEKNTFCILKKNYAIISQHIGDMDSAGTLDFFKITLDNYKKLFNIDKIDLIVYDKHPDYAATKFAKHHFRNSKKIEVQHHKAHVAGVIAENRLLEESKNQENDRILGFAWDGTGYGDDGKVWGSEIFIIEKILSKNALNFERIGHIKEKYMPGGEITIKKPYRMAVSYLYNYFTNQTNNSKKDFADYIFSQFPFYKKIIEPEEIDIIIKQIQTGFNSPLTTSMGRFFDSVSSILNLTHIASYEGEAAIHLEMISEENIKDGYQVEIEDFVIDDYLIFNQIIFDLKNNVAAPVVSAKFHNTLAKAVLDISVKAKKNFGTNIIALSGGVFQNNLLISRCFELLKKSNFNVYSKFKVPVNDGGISLGQAYIGALASKQN
ncbi:MAG: carbamoyltransferase HypF [Actinobacteria bacterium]|nr:carbamoyltransferase HypF [Actinomycetota bacterium]